MKKTKQKVTKKLFAEGRFNFANKGNTLAKKSNLATALFNKGLLSMFILLLATSMAFASNVTMKAGDMYVDGNLGVGTTTPTHTFNNYGTTNLSGNTIIEGSLNVTGLIYGNGSQLTGIIGDNSSWNEPYADGLYMDISQDDWVNISGDTMTGDLKLQQGNTLVFNADDEGDTYIEADTSKIDFYNQGDWIMSLYGAGLYSYLPIRIWEKAEAGEDTPAYGQIWVKDNTPNELYFTDDAGNDYKVASEDYVDDKTISVPFISPKWAMINVPTSYGIMRFPLDASLSSNPVTRFIVPADITIQGVIISVDDDNDGDDYYVQLWVNEVGSSETFFDDSQGDFDDDATWGDKVGKKAFTTGGDVNVTAGQRIGLKAKSTVASEEVVVWLYGVYT